MNVVITINGKKRFVRDRITVFEACKDAGIYVPHFCYHPKLSIAANCRMCLVQVEKSPKPVPACATYVSDGMVINTDSKMAGDAQKGVMEFLLINHPLDCPICDQGGECQLQDLAVGYGSSCSRYGEAKRVVVEKQMGPLISTVMTRCIHCTRCVRFGEEVAGNMEIGMAGRGEHSEIMPFIERTVDSEVSGNMIDICPVGALNSKPFRFSARTWELDRADGVSQHDSWGSYLTVQSKDGEVKRVVPRDREEINECWLSDRDRFAYTGIDSPRRLARPHIRDVGSSKPRATEWDEALEAACKGISEVLAEKGAKRLGVLLSPAATSEEGLLASALARKLGSHNVDHRLRQRDFSLDGKERGVPWLGSSIEDLADVKRLFIVGSNPARELPLLPVRLRRLQKKGLAVLGLSARSLEGQFKCKGEIVTAPSRWLGELARVAAAVVGEGGAPEWLAAFGEPEERHRELAGELRSDKAAVLLGAEAINHARYGALRTVAGLIADSLGGHHGLLCDGANTVGLNLAGAVPHADFMYSHLDEPGLDAGRMVAEGLDAYVLVGCEPLDFADPAAAEAAFARSFTVHVGGYADEARRYADVLLPAAVFAERKGATVNLEGNSCTMQPSLSWHGDSRPTWKVLRMLGVMLGLDGFEYENADHVRSRLVAAGDYGKRLDNKLSTADGLPEGAQGEDATGEGMMERLTETAHFASDQIVRRAGPLQETAIAASCARARMHPDELARLGVAPGARVRVSAGVAAVECEAEADPALAAGCVRCPKGVAAFAALGKATSVKVEAVAGEARTEEAVAAAAG